MPPAVGVGTVCTRSESGITMKLRRTATARTAKVRRQVATAATPKTTARARGNLACRAGASHSLGIRIERLSQKSHLLAYRLQLRGIFAASEAARANRPATTAASPPPACRRSSRPPCPSRRPLVTNGGRGSSGIWFRLQVMPARSRTSWASLAGELGIEVTKVDEAEVIVGPTGDEAEALFREGGAKTTAFPADMGGVLLERRLCGLGERQLPWRR